MCNMNQSLAPQSEIAQRNRFNSQVKDVLHDGLTIPLNKDKNPNGAAARENCDNKMKREVDYLEHLDVCGSDYYNELLKDAL